MNTIKEALSTQAQNTGAKSKAATSASNRRYLVEKIAFGVLWLTGIITIAILVFVVAYVSWKGGQVFKPGPFITDTAIFYPSNNAARDAISTTPNAIGFLSFGYLDERVKALNIEGVAPTIANAAEEDYPVVRPLNLMTHGEPSGAVKAWIDYTLSSEGQNVIAEAGYVPVESESYSAPGTVAGEITVVGSTTVLPLAQELAEAFTAKYGDVSINVQGGGSSAGIKAADRNTADIGMVSRELEEAELQKYHDLEIFPIAYDGIAIVVSPNLDVENLSLEQVREIFAGNITNWKEVGGSDLPITVIAREEGSGTRTTFEDEVMGYVPKGWLTRVINWEFLTTRPKGGLSAEGGISTTIVATAYLVMLTIIIATPIGVGAGIYLVEYAGEMRGQSGWQRNIVTVIRLGVETLAGVPSIIFGLFGYALFVSTLKFGFSMLSAGLAGACLILPVIIRTTEESLLTVPRSYREGSLALGSTQWQTIWKVILPAALPGIITGVILSVGRVVSETAVFYVTLGGSYHMPPSPILHPGEFLRSGGRTMALHLYYLVSDTAAFDKGMATGVVLVISTILINLAINYLSSRLNKRLKGKV